jgi:hypothetical protein
MEQLSANILDHLCLKRVLKENAGQMTPAEIRHAWKLEVRRYVEEDRRIRAALDQRERQERQEKDHRRREQQTLQRLERLAKKQEER